MSDSSFWQRTDDFSLDPVPESECKPWWSITLIMIAIGIDLSSLPITSNLKPQRLHTATPYAITNPIWIDRDNNGWTSPKAPLPTRLAPTGSPPDVRAQFDALPEVSR